MNEDASVRNVLENSLSNKNQSLRHWNFLTEPLERSTFEGELDPKVLVTNLEKTERKLINISVPYITSGIKDEEEKYKKNMDFTMEINKILYQISKT